MSKYIACILGLFLWVGSTFAAPPPLKAIIEYQPTQMNIFPNGSFNLGLGAEPFFPGWRPVAEGEGSVAPSTAPALPSIVNDGSQNNCLKFSVDSEGQMALLLLKTFDLGDTNQTYTLYYKARASRNGIDMRPAQNAAVTAKVVAKPTKTLTTLWSDYYVKIKSVDWDEAPSFRFNIEDNGTTGGGSYEVFIDDMMLVNDSWGITSYQDPVAEVVLIPEKRNGTHLHGTDYPLTWKAQGTYSSDVDLTLYLRDLTRDLVVATHVISTLNLSGGQVHQGVYNLANLKRGHYQALLSITDAATGELLNTGRELFSVISDLTALNDPSFAIGAEHGLESNNQQFEFNYRGFWSTDEYFQQNYQTGIRLQRTHYYLDQLAATNGQFNWYQDALINASATNGCKNLVVVDTVKKLSNEEYDTIMAANPGDGPGYWWLQQGHTVQADEVAGHMGFPENWNNYKQVAAPTGLVAQVAGELGQRYGDNLHFVEYKNEANGAVTAQFILDWSAKPFYSAFKAQSPNSKVFLSTTSNIDGSNPLVASYSTDFFDLGGTNYSDGYSFHAYGAPTIVPGSFDASTPEAEGDASGIERMAVYQARAHNYGLDFGQSECFYFNTPRYDQLEGWDHTQRVLLDVSYGGLYSASVNAMRLYTYETGMKNAWRNKGTGVPSQAAVGLNGLHRVLEGGTAQGVIVKDRHFLIGTFEVNRTGAGTRYVAAIVAGNNTKTGSLDTDLSGVSGLVAYDLCGEEIAPPIQNGQLYVGRNVLYLESDSPTALFNALQTATLNWHLDMGVKQLDETLTKEGQYAYTALYGEPKRNFPMLEEFSGTRVSTVASEYVADLTTLVLSGDPVSADAEGALILDHLSLPGSGAYTKISALVASADVADTVLYLSTYHCDEATLFVNGQTLYSDTTSNIEYRTDWIEAGSLLPIGLSLVELVVKPSADISVVMLGEDQAAPISLGGGQGLVSPTDDTFVYSSSGGDDNYGADSQLKVRGSSNFTRRTFLKFDLRSQIGDITNAVLRLYADSASTDIEVRSLSDNSWDEGTLVWTNAPFGSIDPTVAASATATSGAWVDLDLSSVITNAGLHSFVLDAVDTGSTLHKFASKESSANQPELLIWTTGIEETPSFTLTYSASANGSISGTTLQFVSEGSDGSAVTAVANSGYHFVDWSDASTANPRTDTGVTADVSVTANFTIDPITPESLYADWAALYPSLGVSNYLTNNPDGDLLNNLGEYALGGDPTNGAYIGYVPEAVFTSDGGTNYFEYIHAQRNDAAARGLTYSLELSTNLVSNVWTNSHAEVVGTGTLDLEFDSITNHVPVTDEEQGFIRLRVECQ